jgi:MFS family permease
MSVPKKSVKEITFYYECHRAMASGVLESAYSTFIILIAVRLYAADGASKSILAAGNAMGLLTGMFLVYLAARLKWTASRGAAVTYCAGGAGFLVAALFGALPFFVLGSVVGVMCHSMVVPMLTQIFQENYPDRERGKMFTRTLIYRIAATVVFSYAAGELLTGRYQYVPVLMAIYAAAQFYSGWCVKQCPSSVIRASDFPLFSGIEIIQRDRRFRMALMTWMLMGFGNLMMVALRVEYLANPAHGLALSASIIALLTGVIPNVARLLMTRWWGKLFDRMNFFTLRIILNLGFALATITFFTGESFWALVVGAVIFGVSTAGGEVAWSLWVTKFAPTPHRVAEYMAVHTFLTGVRGLLAPFTAFSLLATLPVSYIALIACGLILVSIVLLWPERGLEEARAHAQPLTEEVLD